MHRHPLRVTAAVWLTAVLFSENGLVYAAVARFEPAAGKVLLIAGQSLEDIQTYVETTKAVPAGLMSYTSINNVEGLENAVNYGDGSQVAQRLLDHYPHTALQLGLWMVDSTQAVARGDLDENIDRLGAWIRKTKRPVFLRVGYEFDGTHNHYPPDEYILAYRRIVDRFRANGIRNAAFVWHSWASRSAEPLVSWYPGDAYVDWVGISYFNQPQSYLMPVIEFAKQHGKPVMIAESSPWNVQTKYANSWALWFAPLFKFIQTHDIKALSYISCDWDATQFAEKHWGDARIGINAELLQRWVNETSKDRYLKSSPDLFREVGFEN